MGEDVIFQIVIDRDSYVDEHGSPILPTDMMSAPINAAKRAFAHPDRDSVQPFHEDLPCLRDFGGRNYLTTLLLLVVEKHENHFPPGLDTREKQARALCHLSNTRLLEIIYKDNVQKAKRLIALYSVRGELNSRRASAFSPMCSHIQMYNDYGLLDHFAGVPNQQELNAMITIYLERHFHDSPNLTRIKHFMTGNYATAKRDFSQPNAVARACRRLGIDLVYHPAELSEDTLADFEEGSLSSNDMVFAIASTNSSTPTRNEEPTTSHHLRPHVPPPSVRPPPLVVSL